MGTTPSMPPGMQAFLSRLAKVEGTVTVHAGVLTFPDATSVDLNTHLAQGLTPCHHCGSLMNAAQRYICGCPRCVADSPVTEKA